MAGGGGKKSKKRREKIAKKTEGHATAAPQEDLSDDAVTGMLISNLLEVLRLRGGGGGDSGKKARHEGEAHPSSSNQSPPPPALVHRDAHSVGHSTAASVHDQMEEDGGEDGSSSVEGDGDDGAFQEPKKKKRKPRNTGTAPASNAHLVVVVDGIDMRRFNGKTSLLKELRRIAPGVQARGATVLNRGGLAILCNTEKDVKAIYDSQFWASKKQVSREEFAFGIDATAHPPNGSTDGGAVMIEPKKVIVDTFPADLLEAELLAELQPQGVVRAVRIPGSRDHHCPWLLEFDDAAKAGAVLQNKIPLFCVLFKCRPVKTTRAPVRCNNCQEYGHSAMCCQKPPVCSECSGPHRYNDPNCEAPGVGTVNKKCPHCFAAGREHNHSAGWKGCPENKERRRLRYAEVVTAKKAEEDRRKAQVEVQRQAAAEKRARDEEARRASQVQKADVSRTIDERFHSIWSALVSNLVEAIVMAFDVAKKSGAKSDIRGKLLDVFHEKLGTTVDVGAIRRRYGLPAQPSLSNQ